MGDVDGDGFGDLRVGADVIFGNERGWLAPSGVSVSSAGQVLPLGDLDGDGFGDFALFDNEGARLLRGEGAGASPRVVKTIRGVVPVGVARSGEAGSVVVLLNAERDGVVLEPLSGAPLSGAYIRFPSVSGGLAPRVAVTDVDGDGEPDVVIVTRLGQTGGPSQAVQATWRGSGKWRSGPRWSTNAPSGEAVGLASVGDVDGDGYGDVVATEGEGCGIRLLRGGKDGLTLAPAVLPCGCVRGDTASQARALGDINGDGYADVLVTLSEEIGDVSYRIFVGGPTGLRRLDGTWSHPPVF